VNGNRLSRILEAEMAVARLSAGAPLSALDALALRDPATLTDAECVDVWRHLAQRQVARPALVGPQEREEILEAWKELTG
jgi:hypothetical protein